MKKFSLPYADCKKEHITQFYGLTHKANDFWFKNCIDTFLCAPDVCEVEQIITDQTVDNDYYPAFKKGYGIVLRSMNNPRYQFLMWHCRQVFPVNVGQRINQGDVVAQIGNSGYCVSGGIEVPLANRGSKGAHLHFEIWCDGVKVDPYPLLDWNAQPKLEKRQAVEQVLIRFRNLVLNIK
jgi:hypothetical protein